MLGGFCLGQQSSGPKNFQIVETFRNQYTDTVHRDPGGLWASRDGPRREMGGCDYRRTREIDRAPHRVRRRTFAPASGHSLAVRASRTGSRTRGAWATHSAAGEAWCAAVSVTQRTQGGPRSGRGEQVRLGRRLSITQLYCKLLR